MIYVHVPFCRSFCTYCGFYSEVAPKCRRTEDTARQKELYDRYASALETEVSTRREDISRVFASGDVNTLYVGGGTPSVLPLDAFRRLVEALKRAGHPCGFKEFTVEVNPEDIVEKGPEYVKGLIELGVNRISMGVQSFDDGILKWMNRRHDAARAVEAYRILEDAGVENISIDLIFGLSQMSEQQWRETLGKALAISPRGVLPKHISAYQLSVEEDSVLERLIAKGRWEEASEEVCERQYEVLCEVLAAAGYNHYEISNFAQPGYEAVHNSAYWRHIPYIGLGPGAHSCLADVSRQCVPTASMSLMRQWNKSDLKAYMAAGEKGNFSAVQEREALDEEQIVLEKIMLGLRTAAGVPVEYLRKHCDMAALDEAFRYSNLVTLENGNVRIPENRFFVSDNIISGIV